MITAVRRASDGLLADIQICPQWPQETGPRINNAVVQFGGAAAEWALIEIPSALWVDINPAARQSASLDGQTVNGITQSTPPSMTSDKASIENDGAEVATITADVNDAEFAGTVRWSVALPDMTCVTAYDVMAGGVATLELTTTVEGAHSVAAEVELFGVSRVIVTGV